MTNSEFRSLLDKERYQVFLFVAPLPMPVHFAVHAWFVIVFQGKVERWEFGKFRNSGNPRGIGILKNFMGPANGLQKYPWRSKKGSTSHLLGKITGEHGSLAHQMAKFILNETPKYPLQKIYRYLGPNSNTYAQWVIDHFPESGFSLTRRAIGRKYQGKYSDKLKLTHDMDQSGQ